MMAAEDWKGAEMSSADSEMAQLTTVRGLHRQLIESIGTSIAIGELATGSQIVPEDLAGAHGISRTVVREVLKVLEAKGMVAARPRIGTRVRPRDEWVLLDPDVIRWRSMGDDASRQIEELLDVRGAIEPLAARQASAAATSVDVASLRHQIDEMRAAATTQDWAAFTEADVAFHRALLLSSGSLIVAQFAEPIEAALRVRHRLNLIPASLSIEVADTHEAIVAAIVEGDGAGAELASRRIVDVAGAETMESLIRNSDQADGGDPR